jgi:DNA-binding LacI/PurR family transcriptional regulator
VRVSLKDVALHAGVSIKTVSNVVNGYQHVTPAMRERVQRSIDELGYQPNLTALWWASCC